MLSVQKKYRFKLGTTSYIYPVKESNLLFNVKKLGKLFDKIQLLFFGRDYLKDVLNIKTVNSLKDLQKESIFEYIIHLPLDLDLMNPANNLNNSLDLIERIMDSYELLNIEEYILHLDVGRGFQYKKIEYNQNSIMQFEKVLSLLKNRFPQRWENIFLENTGYDLTYFKKPVKKYNFPICFDIGHMQLYNFDFSDFITNFKEQIKEIHLHGVNIDKDHLSAKFLEQAEFFSPMKEFLKQYQESIIIEVFDENSLVESLGFIENISNH